MYAGGGRWYDAALGVHLQPDPFGGAPEAPESLNRYAAGVSTFPTIGSVPGGTQNYQNFAIDVASTTVNKTLWYFADEHWTPAGVARAGLSSLGKTTSVWKQSPKTARDFFVRLRISYPGSSHKRWISDELFQPIVSGQLYLNVKTGDIIDIRKTFLNPQIEEVPWRKLGGQSEKVAPSLRARGARFGLDNALSFGIDALWQFGADLGTDMPLGYRFGRAGVAGGVGVVAAGLTIKIVGVGWGALATAGLVSGTVPPLLIIGAGVVVGLTVERWVADRINDWLFPVGD